MMKVAQDAVCSQINRKHINTVWEYPSGQKENCSEDGYAGSPPE
jgi:hypothetical protein